MLFASMPNPPEGLVTLDQSVGRGVVYVNWLRTVLQDKTIPDLSRRITSHTLYELRRGTISRVYGGQTECRSMAIESHVDSVFAIRALGQLPPRHHPLLNAGFLPELTCLP